ncbi:hypothetical protein L2E82_47861 [Cichorium intybus]|uniref:Uncharacterized protein n=1 Tax=Cichorium intybus TaxID=13427 RepID=A0ACB8YXR0_CICIN|nr:hypothetical protein L2E82_47861 [Cichorium intybus]
MILGANFDSHGGGEKPSVIVCHACQNHISSGFAYGCIQCQHFMHKKCSRIPPTVNLPSLYEHPLTLFDFGEAESIYWSCYVCRARTKLKGFCYTSYKTEHNVIFNACIDCCIVELDRKAEVDAIKEEARIKIEHEGHPQHTLSLQLRPGSFRCDACNAKDEGLFYQCDSCDFWIHKSCAFLDHSIKLPHHHNHPLVLVYFAHIKCALNAEWSSAAPSDDLTAEKDENGLVHFPMLDAFTDPLKLLHFENVTENDDEKTNIDHWSHLHPLILNVEHQANNMSGSSDPIENVGTGSVVSIYALNVLLKCTE